MSNPRQAKSRLDFFDADVQRPAHEQAQDGFAGAVERQTDDAVVR